MPIYKVDLYDAYVHPDSNRRENEENPNIVGARNETEAIEKVRKTLSERDNYHTSAEATEID